MRKAVVVLGVAVLIGAGVWYAVERFPPLTEAGAALAGVARDTLITAADSDSAFAVPARGLASCGMHCGQDRWAVKTLSDRDRDLVHLRPVNTTIEELGALDRPPDVASATRAGPEEMTVYRVEARLRRLIQEDDRDWHLVLESPRDSTVTMVAEMPDPECAGACSSGFAERFARVRSVLFDRLNAPGGERRPLLRVTGVAFFDYPHGQIGAAPNGIELHPVLEVEFP